MSKFANLMHTSRRTRRLVRGWYVWCANATAVDVRKARLTLTLRRARGWRVRAALRTWHARVHALAVARRAVSRIGLGAVQRAIVVAFTTWLRATQAHKYSSRDAAHANLASELHAARAETAALAERLVMSARLQSTGGLARGVARRRRYAAWQVWSAAVAAHATEAAAVVRKCTVMERIVGGRSKSSLTSAFAQWRLAAIEARMEGALRTAAKQHTQTSVAHKIARHLLARGARSTARAWHTWRASITSARLASSAAELHTQRMRAVVRSWSRRRLSIALATWKSFMVAVARVGRVLLRIRLRELAASFRAWIAGARLVAEHSALAARSILRLRQRDASRAMRQWRAFVAACALADRSEAESAAHRAKLEHFMQRAAVMFRWESRGFMLPDLCISSDALRLPQLAPFLTMHASNTQRARAAHASARMECVAGRCAVRCRVRAVSAARRTVAAHAMDAARFAARVERLARVDARRARTR